MYSPPRVSEQRMLPARISRSRVTGVAASPSALIDSATMGSANVAEATSAITCRTACHTARLSSSAHPAWGYCVAYSR